MNSYLQNRLYVGLSVAVLLVLLIGAVSLRTFRNQSNEASRVRHAYQVLNQAEQVYKHLIDMETSRRGYRASGVRRFLQPYNVALQRIQPAVQSLKEMVGDDAPQLARATIAQKRIDELLQFWADEQDIAPAGDRAALVGAMYQEKDQVDAIRTELDAIIDTERRLLNKRQQANDESITMATYVLVLGTLLTLMLVLLLINRIVNELKTRARAERTLQSKLGELEVSNQTANDRNWLLTGIALVGNTLQNSDQIGPLSDETLSTIILYLGLPAGAFYAYEEENDRLVLQSSVALPEDAPSTIPRQEGLLGQATKRRDVTVYDGVPASYWKFQTATGQDVPGQIVCVPLWYNKEFKGLLELASFGPMREQGLQLLRSVGDNIAVAVNAADSRRRMRSLLGQVQEQREELLNQQEELRQSNEELQRQAQILQSSEEELRVQEEELRQINAELEERNEAVEVARKALSQKAKELEQTSRYKSEFLANMSHELRTPLNSVLILAKMLSENKAGNLSGKQVEYADIIHRSGSDLLDLINDILDLSKIEAGRLELQFETVSVGQLVDNVQQLFSVVADERGVRWHVEQAPQVPTLIRTDQQRLEQVLKNLLSNAFKFTPKEGTVSLALSTMPASHTFHAPALQQGGAVLAIAVSDTGIGISPEKQQIIFEAFQQADGSTSRRFGGTGLGLSISKELVSKLGGEIGLESNEGKGSTFTIYLPTTATDVTPANDNATAGRATLSSTDKGQYANGVETSAKPAATASAAPATLFGANIHDDRDALQPGDRIMLIVEDDPIFARLVQDFARQKSYKTVVAQQGDEGLHYARLYRPSAIILDMHLPVMDGWAVLKELKEDPALSAIPVHIMSATDEPLPAGTHALALLHKPASRQSLEEAFSIIGRELSHDDRRVLVLSTGRQLTDDTLRKLINDRSFSVTCDFVTSPEEARALAAEHTYDCLIVDPGPNLASVTQQVDALQEAMQPHKTPVIIYVSDDLTPDDERQLRRVSNAIVRESSLAKDRLMDELELFLFKLQQPDEPKLVPVPGDVEKSLIGKRILLVDDDMRNVFALSTLLEDQEMDVITAGDGQEALDLLAKHHADIDMVLMDIMMPEMDGYEATRRIRADARFARLPVIALTAKAMKGDRQKCIDAGASDYIAKPVDAPQLLSLMRVWLAK